MTALLYTLFIVYSLALFSSFSFMNGSYPRKREYTLGFDCTCAIVELAFLFWIGFHLWGNKIVE